MPRNEIVITANSIAICRKKSLYVIIIFFMPITWVFTEKKAEKKLLRQNDWVSEEDR